MNVEPQITNTRVAVDAVHVLSTRDNNMALGNPSNATSNICDFNNYLLVKGDYSLSYNRSNGTPNWVSWHLSMAWKGNAPRVDRFAGDATLPSDWVKVFPSNYANSGFNKGHMCPSADRDASPEDNKETFKMTNMVPQSPKNNQQTWRYLETYCQNLAKNGNEMYIMSGPYGSGGEGANGYATSMGNGKVKVPSKMWKVVVVLPDGSNDLSRITTTTRVIAVIMPNTQSVNTHPWAYYRVSVDQIEALTGYNFLSAVPASIQNAIEAHADNVPIL
ncbi:MAG TPA: DNA/RNA non-specific endonuclease [Bacteroidia bacterium]